MGTVYTAFEAVTVSTTAVALTAATFGQSNEAFITVENGAVRFRMDGTAPTASQGHELDVGDSLTLDSRDQIERIRFIRRNGVDATLRVSYGR